MLELSVRAPPFGPLLTWGPVGALLGRIGAPWAVLGLAWGPLGAILGTSWAVLERWKPENARMPKSLHNLKGIFDVCLRGPSCGSSWSPLEASWQSWGNLERLGALLGRRGGLSGRLGGFLGLSWPVEAPSYLRRGRRQAGKPQGSSPTPAGLKRSARYVALVQEVDAI